MKTSISSKAFSIITDRHTTKDLQIVADLLGESAQKIGAISQLWAEKITFPPKRG